MYSKMSSNNCVQTDNLLSDDNFLSDDELFNMYSQAVENKNLTTDTIFQNKRKIIALLRIIENSDDNSIEYKEANKKLSILTLKKPSFFKQVFNLT